MSDALTAAAEALGVPAELVKRSAEAKAKALGGSADDYIASWGGGAPPPAPTPPAAPPEPTEASTEQAPAADAPVEPTAVPAPVASSEPAPAPAATPATAAPREPARPPILEGRNENPLMIMAGAVAILAVTLFLGLFAPSIPEPANGVYSSAVPLSEAGREGRSIYLAEGCAVCHTQVVRVVVSDAGLGGVTVSDSNQVLGNRRIGPDLAHVGSRMQGAEIASLLAFSSDHPSYRHLEAADLDRLVSYLKESK